MAVSNLSAPVRACLYARYSTDLQRSTSIVDQLRAARERADLEGWEVVAVHSDDAVSGSVPVGLRNGGGALLKDAESARFDVLLLEGLDRLSRDSDEAGAITRQLEFDGVRIIGTADGYDSLAEGSTVLRIARGMINQIFLEDLRKKTHRGLAGQFDRGLHVGGKSYGYRSREAADNRGHELVIEQAEAAIVRRIFQDFAAGRSARSIVHALNAYFSPSWTAFQADRGRDFSVIVDGVSV